MVSQAGAGGAALLADAPAPGANGGAPSGIGAVERELALLVRRSRSASRRMSQQVHPDVDAAAFGLLTRLAEVGASRPSDLAEFFGVGKPTVGRQLTCLEQLGLVGRRPDPDDGRAHLLEVTEHGRLWLAAQREGRQAVLAARLAQWSDRELVDLARVLGRLNDVLR
ncbi:MarR family winged helix-turn-helix transcriptional regulator [Luteimicrobium sp. DT211]|uniref:MarR family winged helix-turn-helix transcriptional regulator n=1 Tax=Luteimicrobium sp. DT211 TaxID=3393412 RepID=UPI003CE8A615